MTDPLGNLAHSAAEKAARQSYGHLLAILARRSGNLAAAEDALATAFALALQHWPQGGVPDNPQAWLLTAARREQQRTWRHFKIADAAVDEWLMRLDERASARQLPDERLTLMFACTHDAIEPDISTALMLQTVLGLNAAKIASAFLTSPKTMGQRLVRAKARLKQEQAAFELPEPADWAPRLHRVLAAIYAAFGMAWEDAVLASDSARDLHDEAIWLARLLTECLPDEPEPKGLLALMLYCEARRRARRDGNGAFIPLDRQNHLLWHQPSIVEAGSLLESASRHGNPGRFQTEAAIQSLHIHSRQTTNGRSHTTALLALYDLLTVQSPSLGALVSRAAAYSKAGAHSIALEQLDELPESRIASYQPYWATRAFTLIGLNRLSDANAAFDRAIGLSIEPAIREFLLSAKIEAAASKLTVS